MEVDPIINSFDTLTSNRQYVTFQIWMWGQLRQQSTPEPKLTQFVHLNCIFANFSWPQVCELFLQSKMQLNHYIGLNLILLVLNESYRSLSQATIVILLQWPKLLLHHGDQHGPEKKI